MIGTLDNLKTLSEIQRAFPRQSKNIAEIFKTFCELGFFEKKSNQLKAKDHYLILKRNDPEVWKHHENFRHLGLESLGNRDSDSFYYSTSFTCSEEDAESVKQLLRSTFLTMNSKIKASPAESVFALNTDFFRVFK